MDKNYTHSTFILDRSGSMWDVWPDIVGGYKTLVEQQQKERGKCTFSLYVFDREIERVEVFTEMNDVSPTLEIQPRGMTALLDAIGIAIVETGERLAALEEAKRPSKVVVFVQTDGFENSSKEYPSDKIKEMVEKQTNEYNWEFIFLGATLDACQQSVALGFNQSNTSTYSTGATYSAGISRKLAGIRGATVSELKAATAFTEKEKSDLNA